MSNVRSAASAGPMTSMRAVRSVDESGFQFLPSSQWHSQAQRHVAQVIEPTTHIDLSFASNAERFSGDPPTAIFQQSALHGVGDVALCRLGCESIVLPKIAAVITTHDELMNAPFAEARSAHPRARRTPYLRARDHAMFEFTPPPRFETLTKASIWLPFGARKNWGHFLLDALPSLLALTRDAHSRDAPALCPPLTSWQRELLNHFSLDRYVTEISAEAICVRTLCYATSMNHYLHRANALVRELRDRLPSPRNKTMQKLYLSRRRFSGRILVNEDELETALARAGFTIVCPEQLPVHAQIELLRDARVVVGASGAALASALFCQPNTQIIELLPTRYPERWLQLLCHTLDLRWHGHFLSQEHDVGVWSNWRATARQLPRILSGRYHARFRVPVPRFLDALQTVTPR